MHNDQDDVRIANDDDVETQMDATYGERTSTHNLRPRRRRSYSHLHVNIQDHEGVTYDKLLATPQMSMQRGIKLFGDDGVKAVADELQQLHDRIVMKAKHTKDLTQAQHKEALAYLMFLKRKRTGKVKGWGCADGRKQRDWISKEESASPTNATEAVFLTAVIDALENRDVAINELYEKLSSNITN